MQGRQEPKVLGESKVLQVLKGLGSQVPPEPGVQRDRKETREFKANRASKARRDCKAQPVPRVQQVRKEFKAFQALPQTRVQQDLRESSLRMSSMEELRRHRTSRALRSTVVA